jgi:hypothetical protein
VSVRPLFYVAGLTLADYVLWRWSLSNHHDTLSTISGLSVVPLGAACLWLFALALMRLIARHTRLPARRSRRQRAVSREAVRPGQAASGGAPALEQPAARSTSAGSSSGKLAA